MSQNCLMYLAQYYPIKSDIFSMFSYRFLRALLNFPGKLNCTASLKHYFISHSQTVVTEDFTTIIYSLGYYLHYQ